MTKCIGERLVLRLVKTECRLVRGHPMTGPTPQKMVPWRRPRNPIHASPRPLTRDDKYQQNDETPSPPPPPTYFSLSHTCSRCPTGRTTGRLTLVSGPGEGAGDRAMVLPDRALPDPLWRNSRCHHPRSERSSTLLCSW